MMIRLICMNLTNFLYSVVVVILPVLDSYFGLFTSSKIYILSLVDDKHFHWDMKIKPPQNFPMYKYMSTFTLPMKCNICNRYQLGQGNQR